MKISKIELTSYEATYLKDSVRKGLHLSIFSSCGHKATGEIAPFPGLSHETLLQTELQLSEKQSSIMAIDWNEYNVYEELKKLSLYPSVSFGLETALLSIVDPIRHYKVPVSAWLSGSVKTILDQADARIKEGFKTAKIKVSQLTFEEAHHVLKQLKSRLRLRVDVNRAWTTEDAISFFESYDYQDFDYIEEPFKNPKDLALFKHPLAIDESYPHDLTLEQISLLPSLKAIIYKPMVQGGLSHCFELLDWVNERDITMVLSSTYETEVGLKGIASLGYRLGLTAPYGIGTALYMDPSHFSLDFRKPELTVA